MSTGEIEELSQRLLDKSLSYRNYEDFPGMLEVIVTLTSMKHSGNLLTPFFLFTRNWYGRQPRSNSFIMTLDGFILMVRIDGDCYVISSGKLIRPHS